MAVRAVDEKHLKTTPPPEPQVQIQNNFTEVFSHNTLCQNFQNRSASPTMLPPELYIRNMFKRHFLENH